MFDSRRQQEIKFPIFEVGASGAERKIVQNAVFRGKRHENKILKVQILLSKNRSEEDRSLETSAGEGQVRAGKGRARTGRATGEAGRGRGS